MVFSSLKFLFVFMPAVLGIYFLVYRFFKKSPVQIFALNLTLLLASLEFYLEGEPKFIWVMLLTGGIDFVVARLINREQDRHQGLNTSRTRWLLWMSIVANMGLLFYFKYFNFAIDTIYSITGMTASSRIWLEVALPIGISFYTFESMSYTIDVYHKEVRASKSLVNYWTFITFFPHLIAGPIIRYIDLRSQLESRPHSVEQIHAGIHRFIVGLGKKVIIANPLAFHADYLFALDASKMDGLSAWLAAGCYTLQIYFDFSGYSDMAIGLAKIFGIELPENFNYPYISRSVQDFWRRWHMTLSRWFRDYFYIPLGGNRLGHFKEYRNLLLVFFVCGLWHGASLNFVCWGLWHGIFLVLERNLKSLSHIKLPQAAVKAYVLLVVIFGWVLFRADTLPQALQMWKSMAGFGPSLASSDALDFVREPQFFVYFILGVVLSVPHPWYRSLKREPVYLVIFFISLCFLCGQTYNPFIYFRF